MSLDTALARVSAIERMLAPPPAAATATAATPASSGFATALEGAMSPGTEGFAVQAKAAGAGAYAGQPAIVQAAASQLGVTETTGTNDGPQIAGYRAATAGAPGPGPWCAYFVSWCARQAGTPLGDQGQGFGSVDQMWSWAQRSGRAIPNGPGVVPQAGDVVVFNQHTGIVTGVGADGSIQTIEGNTSDSVAPRSHAPGEVIGYIRVGAGATTAMPAANVSPYAGLSASTLLGALGAGAGTAGTAATAAATSPAALAASASQSVIAALTGD